MKENIELTIKKIASLVKKDDYETALNCCDELIADAPQAWIAYREKADILESLKRYNEALVVRETLIDIGSDEPSDYYDLCRLSLKLGKNNEAIHWADECIKLSNIHNNFYYHDASVFYKANALLNLKRYQEAIDASNTLENGYGTYLSGIGMRTKEDILKEAGYSIKNN